jgi:hypothetical protein
MCSSGRRSSRALRAVLAVALVAGCSAGPGDRGSLHTVLVSPTDVALSWAADDPSAAGHTVEYATDPAGPFTILAFVPAGRTGYTHPRLMPRTTFYYRTRPYYGPVSNVVTVTLPPGTLDDPTGDSAGDSAGGRQPDWAAPQALPQPSAARSAGGAPTGLTATVHDANGIRFTWTDHASDETGYLLEVKPVGSADFTVVDVLDPDVDAVGFVLTSPSGKAAAYRVRAFRYGLPSEVVSATTGTA